MTGHSPARHTRVRSRNLDMAGATHGIVLASFDDFNGKAYTVVLWDGESMTITEAHWLEATHR